MKPKTATALTVSLLLLGSVLCVGARYTIDRQNAADDTNKGQAGASASVPEDSRKTLKPERPMATPSNSEAMAQRLRAIFATSNEANLVRALLDLISTLKGDDWSLAVDAMKEIGVSTGSVGHLMIISGWTESDPQAAMAWGKSNQMETYVISPWIRRDPDAAIAFLKSMEDLKSATGILVHARAMGALGEDLPHIREVLMMVPERSCRMLVEQSQLDISKVREDTLNAWVDSFEGVRREQVMKLVLKSLKGMEAKLAFAGHFPDDIGPKAYGPIYEDWLKADEAAALRAFEGIEPGDPLHEPILYAIAHGLYLKGRLAESLALTRRWPEKISPGFLSDLLFINDVKDAPLVLAEIPRLQDGPLKVNRYQCVLEPWFKEAPEAARKWLAENEVPEQVRKEFEGK